MKIYVITSGCYSDYHIDAVTDDKDRAEFLKLKFSDEYDEANIEEYDTDEYRVEGMPNQLYWKVRVYKGSKPIIRPMLSGEVKFVVYNTHIGASVSYCVLCEAVVIAKTKEQALEIVRDKYAKYLAEKLEFEMSGIEDAFKLKYEEDKNDEVPVQD